MRRQLIASTADGREKMYATIKMNIAGNIVYWGYIEARGEKSKTINLSTIMASNNSWIPAKGIDK